MYSKELINSLNEDIKQFPQIFPIEEGMNKVYDGVSRLVMLDRYSFKDTEKKTLKEGDFVVLTIKSDPKFPARGHGVIRSINWNENKAIIKVSPEFNGVIDDEEEARHMEVERSLDVIEKPLELYYEQIAKRNAKGLASVESTDDKVNESFKAFSKQLADVNFVPAGRVLYGAGSGAEVTYFNCYVMPFIKDSRGGISEHRKEVMEIMSRGGGVGTNGTTLRPRNTLARSVNGKSSGSVSWLNDLANLTNLVEQGGSRRGAQMIMMADYHPDVIEFIISKMQNPKILQFLIENTEDEQIKELAMDKLKFTPLSQLERETYEVIVNSNGISKELYNSANEKLYEGGTYSVNSPDFLTGANISVCLTKEFMEAVDKDGEYELRFPDVENYTPEEMKVYNEKWHKVGDVREWEKMGYGIKTYRKIKARELWNLINICATYSAEPGIFFIDNANDMTNSKAYGQSVVATNPCGEQPLAPYSVCNLGAINLANMADKKNKTVDVEKLKETVRVAVRMQDNVIDATPYFLEENKKQALGERRVGLGVMGLHDLLIYCEKEYGSEAGNELVDKIFSIIAITAYETSIELAKEKGSFPFLIADDCDVDNELYDEQFRSQNTIVNESTMELRKNFINTGYMKQMPEHIREGILKHGIRNSHLLTVAPTGSTGTMVGVSTGLEPYFSFSYFRSGRLGKFIEVNAGIVDEFLEANPEYTKDTLPNWFVSAMDLSPDAHADTQCVIQRWVDSSISKTVNAPKGYAVNQVQAVYERLYKGGAKGGTVYVDGSRDSQVLTLTADDNDLNEAVEIKKPKVMIIDTIKELNKTNTSFGSEVGETCPICRKGKVVEAGGCNTCKDCGAQLKCGL